MHKLAANWRVSSNVQAFITLRTGGCSTDNFASNNVALHVDDEIDRVMNNRQQLKRLFNLPSEPFWLNQTHSSRCVVLKDKPQITDDCNFDAVVTQNSNQVLGVMTGDCLPILLTNTQGSEIAAIHGGWRGLAKGIIENTLALLKTPPNEMIAWIGPGICGNCYAVGQEMHAHFSNRYSFAKRHFVDKNKQIYANLPALAENILTFNQVRQVFQSNQCTFENKNDFYSYRRVSQTGRMVSLIWFN